MNNSNSDIEGKDFKIQNLFKFLEKEEIPTKEEIRNLFSHKSSISPEEYEIPEMPDIYRSLHRNDEEIHRREKADLLKQLERFNDNVRHAILLRTEKDNKSEFYRKLETLTERIHIYKNIFYAKQPKFVKKTKKIAKNKQLKDSLHSPVRRVRFFHSIISRRGIRVLLNIYL